MSKEAMKLALERLQARTDTADLDAIAALNEALAEQPAQTCSRHAEAERLADALEVRGFLGTTATQAAAELRRLQHNNLVLMDALWKACGDDKQLVKEYIESQGELK